jgi:hypothetical protein
MTTLIDQLPTAKDLMKRIALAEAEKASQAAREHSTAEAEKKALIERLKKPTGLTDEEKIQRAAGIVRRAVESGLTEVLATASQMNSAPTMDALSIKVSRAGRTR